jgi:NitT/TauT family transport system substrate-binding protein
MIATDGAIARKRDALKELIHYIHKAGNDIDQARAQGGKPLEEIAVLINKYIPTHSVEAIKQSLNAELGVINYSNLSPEKAGIKHIMDLAVEGRVLKKAIDIDQFTDESLTVDTKKD